MYNATVAMRPCCLHAGIQAGTARLRQTYQQAPSSVPLQEHFWDTGQCCQ